MRAGVDVFPYKRTNLVLNSLLFNYWQKFSLLSSSAVSLLFLAGKLCFFIMNAVLLYAKICCAG